MWEGVHGNTTFQFLTIIAQKGENTMNRTETELVEREQEKLVALIGQDAKLAIVAINSFVTAYTLLKKQAA